MSFLNKRQQFDYEEEENTPVALYNKLKKYYDNNDLYKDIRGESYSRIFKEYIKPVRTPVHRSVETFVAWLGSGEIKIVTDSNSVLEAIQQIQKWSNFQAQKKPMIRGLSLYGNLFVRVQNSENKVYFENIDPRYVTDFETDNRGYLTMIRLDIPIEIEEKPFYHVEYWDKVENYMAVWEYPQTWGANKKLDQLSDPKELHFITDFGIDFIPFCQIKFTDSGSKFGDPCVLHALGKVDQANLEASRLNDLLLRFNKALFVASSNSVDKEGKPLPAPRFKNSKNDSEDDLELRDNTIIRMPGISTLSSLTPQIDYDAALNILKDLRDDIEKDLPELLYSSLKDSSNLSGKAVKLLMQPALSRAGEAQGNFKAGLIRLNEMALSIAIAQGILSPSLGNYENGDFDHDLIFPDMIPMSTEDKSEMLKNLTGSNVPLKSAMLLAGFSEEEADSAMEEKQTEDTKQESLLLKMGTNNMVY